MIKDENNYEYNIAKGTIFLIIAKIIFLISGYGINIVSARILGPNIYGIIGVIISIMTIMNLFLITGLPRATAKFFSENKDWSNNLIKKAIYLQVSFLFVFSVLFIALSFSIAQLLGDISLLPYMILMVTVIPFYALFSIYNDGFLNGLGAFQKQAISNIVFSVTKFLVITLLIIIGFSINSVIIGYLIATILGFVIAFYYFLKIPISGSKIFPMKKLMRLSIQIILYSIFIILIFNVDLLSIKAILKDNVLVGYYTSASMIARIPYFIFNGLAIVLLPSISYLVSKKDFKKTQNQIKNSIRYMLMVILPFVLLINSTSKSLLKLFYSNEYVSASSSLQILIFGLGLLSFISIFSHIIMGAGKPNFALITTFLTLIIALICNQILIPIYGLIGAALSTLLAASIGFFIIGYYIYELYKAPISIISTVRIFISAISIFILSSFIHLNGILLIIEYCVLFIIYFAILRILKELNNDDLNLIYKIVPDKISKILIKFTGFKIN